MSHNNIEVYSNKLSSQHHPTSIALNQQFIKVLAPQQILPHLYRVQLCFDEPVSFEPGQYLKLWLNKSTCRMYSIASDQYHDNMIEVLIQCQDSDSVASALIKSMQLLGGVEVTLPYGKAFYRDNNEKNIFIIVTGVGYAYGKSILLRALKNKQHKHIFLVWLARDDNNIFDKECLMQLQAQDERFHLKTVVNRDDKKFEISQDVLNFIKPYLADCKQSSFYLAGHPEKINVLQKQLVEIGVAPHTLFSDN